MHTYMYMYVQKGFVHVSLCIFLGTNFFFRIDRTIISISVLTDCEPFTKAATLQPFTLCLLNNSQLEKLTAKAIPPHRG